MAALGAGVVLLALAVAALYAWATGRGDAVGGALLVAMAGLLAGAAGLVALVVGAVLWGTSSRRQPPRPDPRSMHRLRVVVAPDVSVQTIDAALGRLGLIPCFDPVRAGEEPAVAAWRDATGVLAAFYAFSPHVRLRLLEVRVDFAPRLEGRVPVLDLGTIGEMLASGDRTKVCLGLLAADAIAPDDALAPFIEAATILRHHPDPRVVACAIEVRGRLLSRAARLTERPASLPQISGPAEEPVAEPHLASLLRGPRPM